MSGPEDESAGNLLAELEAEAPKGVATDEEGGEIGDENVSAPIDAASGDAAENTSPEAGPETGDEAQGGKGTVASDAVRDAYGKGEEEVVEEGQVAAPPGDRAKGDASGNNDEVVVITDMNEARILAKEHRERMQPRIPNKEHLEGYKGRAGQKYSLMAPTYSETKPSLGDMGIGISLYFDTVKILGWMFLLMFICGVPSIIVTFVANPEAAAQAVEGGGPLAALKVFSVSAMFKTSTSQPYGCDENECTLKSGATVETKTLAYIMVYFDLLYCLVFVIATLYMKSRFREMIDEVDEGNTTAADYAVSVWGIPGSATPESLSAHFGKYDGSVCPPPAPSGLEAMVMGQNKVAPEAGAAEQGGVVGATLPDIEAPNEALAEVPLQNESKSSSRNELRAVVVCDNETSAGDQGGIDGTGATAPEPEASQGQVPGSQEAVVEASGAQFGGEAVPEGNVVDVFLVRRDAAILTRMEKIGVLAGELEVIQKVISTAKSDKKREKAEAKKAKLEEKKTRLESWVNEKADAKEVNPVVGAFVMFETQDGADDCVRHYQSKGSKAVLPCLKPRPEFLLESQHKITVGKAVEPSDLLFENLEVGSLERYLRKAASSFASFIVIIVSFAVIVYGKSYNEALKVTDTKCINATTIAQCNNAVNWASTTSVGCPSGLSSCTLAQAWNISDMHVLAGTPLQVDHTVSPRKTSIMDGSSCRIYQQDTSNLLLLAPSNVTTQCKQDTAVGGAQWQALVNDGYSLAQSEDDRAICEMCACKALQDSGSILWLSSIGDGATTKALGGAVGPCTAQADNYFSLLGLQIAATILVVVFNNVMKITTRLLAFFERHHTVAEQETSIAFAVFVGQFINTGLVSLVVYADIRVISSAIKKGLDGDASAFPLFAGSFSDFTELWYGVVGAQLMITVITTIVQPVIPMITSAISGCLLPLTTKSLPSQAMLNRAYEGEDFLLSTRYGIILTVLFVCFTYSSGMPILLLFASVIFLFIYWTDKVQLLRFSRLPPQYSAKLALYFVDLMPYAVMLHLFFGVWIFSATKETGENLFPRPSLSESFEASVQGWIDEAFGCAQLIGSSACDAHSSCMWSTQQETGGSAACIIDKESEEWQAFASFSWMARLCNAITFPYFLFAVLFFVLIVIQYTPLSAGMRWIKPSALVARARRWRLVTGKSKSGGRAIKWETRPAKEKLEGAVVKYSEALETGRFGNAATDYDITKIGKYKDICARGRNLQLFRSVSPHTPLQKQDSRR